MAESVEKQRFLLCRLSSSWCALSLQGLGEVMRPQPVDPVGGLPDFVDGVSIIRGVPLPVINLPRLLCGLTSPGGSQERFVTAESDGQPLALRVDEVAGIYPLAEEMWRNLPSLLDGLQSEHVAALGNHDGHVVMLLRRANLLSEADWARLQS
jgi:purine-binding chemotaxis protein CheW